MLGLPEAYVLGCQADDVTLAVNDAGTGTAGSDINADIQVLVHLDLFARISGCLPSTKWQRGHLVQE